MIGLSYRSFSFLKKNILSYLIFFFFFVVVAGGLGCCGQAFL